jgi:hypothetical protein
MKLTLKTPVTVGSEMVTELTFRDSCVSGDLRGCSWTKISENDHDTLMKVAGRLCGQTDVVMAGLSIEDTCEVAKFVLGFFAKGS